MIPRTFVPAMSASTEGPLAAPAATPRARPPPGAFRGALGPASAAERPLPSARAAPAAAPRGASAATSAAAVCSSARQRRPAGGAREAVGGESVRRRDCFRNSLLLLPGARRRRRRRGAQDAQADAVPAEEARQHDATVVGRRVAADGAHATAVPATARIIPRSAAGRRRAAAVAGRNRDARARRNGDASIGVVFTYWGVGALRAVRDGGGVCFRGAHAAHQRRVVARLAQAEQHVQQVDVVAGNRPGGGKLLHLPPVLRLQARVRLLLRGQEHAARVHDGAGRQTHDGLAVDARLLRAAQHDGAQNRLQTPESRRRVDSNRLLDERAE